MQTDLAVQTSTHKIQPSSHILEHTKIKTEKAWENIVIGTHGSCCPRFVKRLLIEKPFRLLPSDQRQKVWQHVGRALKLQPEEEPDAASNIKCACSFKFPLGWIRNQFILWMHQCIQRLAALIFIGCALLTAYWKHPQHEGRLVWPRPKLAGQRVVMTWPGKRVLSQTVSKLVLSIVPHSVDSPSSQAGGLVEKAVLLLAPQASAGHRQKKRGKSVHPNRHLGATASLGSAARHYSFHVALQGNHQPFRTILGALASPPHPGFEETVTTFYCNGYFLFVYADNHLLAPQLFHTFFLLSVPCFASSCC